MPLPERVTLGAIGFVVQEHEGLIVFSEDGGFYGCYERIVFERKEECWWLHTSTTFNKILASHVVQAYEIVKEEYGESFELKRRIPGE